MDVYCPKCGEPWDPYEFHYVAEENETTYSKVAAEFRRKGCQVFDNQPCADPIDRTRALAAAVIYELAGDDMDGAAADLADFEALRII